MAISPGNKIALAVAATAVAGVCLFVALGTRSGPTKKSKMKATKDAEDKSATSPVENKEENSGAAGGSKDPDMLKKEGNSRFTEGKYEEAIELYSQAIALNPKPSEMSKYYANRAACYARLKKYDEVVADCTMALDLEPGYVKALHRRAQAYEALEKLQEAVKDYANAVRLQSNVTEQQVISQSADMVLQKIAQKKAKEKLKEKKGLFPSSAIVKTYLSTFKPKEVTETQEELRAMTDKSAMAAYKLGLCLSMDAKYKEALEYFTKAAELDPHLAVAHTERGTLLHLSGNLNTALEAFAQAASIDPNSVDNLVKWANAMFFVGDVEKANSMLEQAIATDPTDTVAYFHAGQAMSQQGNFAKAIEYFTKVIELDPQNHAALNHRGMAYTSTVEREVDPLAAQHSVEMAIKDFEAAIHANPSEPDAYNSYGVLLRALERPQEALNQFDTAIKVAPKSPAAYTNKGFHKMQVDNDKAAAKELFLKALEVEPSWIEALCNLAIVHLETSIEEAIKCYDHAIELSFFEQDLATIYTFREAAALSKELGVGRP